MVRRGLLMWRALERIRVRLVVGFGVCFIGVSLFVALSYRYFLQLESRLFSLNLADEMVNLSLEARRYEKNYFLYRQEADFQEALKYLAQLEQALLAQRGIIQESMGLATWTHWRELTWLYRRALSVIYDLGFEQQGSSARADLLREQINTIRSAGYDLIGLAEQLAKSERAATRKILSRYRVLFGIFFVSTLSLGALIVYFLEKKVVRPLSVIEKATVKVATGSFETIEWNSGGDEISSLVRAFNQMVVQLKENREQMVRTEKLTALGTLTSGVAHELNNPLSNISTSCQIILEEAKGVLPGHHLKLLASVEDQVMKARDIVRALLEFSRQREFEPRPVDLKEVVDDTLKLLRGDIPARVEVRSEVSEGTVIIMDKAKMQQVFINLIMNGIQAIKDQGSVVVRARLESSEGYVLIEVEDTGCGIAPEVLPRVFDPFFTTKEVGRGTGLGLSVAHGIVERHNGKIWIESEVGKGTKVFIELPLNQGG